MQKFYDPNEKSLTKKMRQLTAVIKKFIDLKNPPFSVGVKGLSQAIDKVVYRFLSEIRYLFKSADYKFENELRVIQYALPIPDPESNLVKIDDKRGLPKKLYIESTKPIRPYIRKIYLGPKISSLDKWVYLEAVMKMKDYPDMELKKSVCLFQ